MTVPGNLSALLPPGPTGPAGLSSLASPGQSTRKTADPRTLAQTAIEVESLFLTQLLEKLRQALLSGCSSPKSAGMERYQYLADQQAARTLAAGGGLGLAQKLFMDLTGRSSSNHHKTAAQPGENPGEPSHVMESGNSAL